MKCKHVPRPELKPGDLIAHFQWNYGWGNWEQVIPEAAGQDGVVAAYCAPAATASPAAGIDREREAISPASTEGVESRAALIDGIWDEAVDLLVVTGLGHLVGTSGASALIEGFADAVLLYQKGGER